uniref:Uncharacterized protein n=1 Tax=Hyaloperonospora arabidopsidis (strain Emoy2) TaxID=559515 RepID=M4BUD6_HYAAE
MVVLSASGRARSVAAQFVDGNLVVRAVCSRVGNAGITISVCFPKRVNCSCAQIQQKNTSGIGGQDANDTSYQWLRTLLSSNGSHYVGS